MYENFNNYDGIYDVNAKAKSVFTVIENRREIKSKSSQLRNHPGKIFCSFQADILIFLQRFVHLVTTL